MEKREKKNSNRSVIIAAVLAILLSLLSLIGGTLALFSADVGISDNVLQAGSLSVTLERTSLQKTHLGEDGLLVAGADVADDPAKDFTNSNANVFDLTSENVIVPHSKYIATMRLTNTGTVAFNFEASLNVIDTANPSHDTAKLSDQITLKLVDEAGNEFKTGTVLAGTNNTCVFKVVLEFNDLDTNNDVMKAAAKVNLMISCVQKTGL